VHRLVGGNGRSARMTGGGGEEGGGEEGRGEAVYFASRRRGEGERGTEGCVLLHNASTQLCAECALRDNRRESHERGGREEGWGRDEYRSL